jgi:hypothetical protein
MEETVRNNFRITIFGQPVNWSKLGEELDRLERALDERVPGRELSFEEQVMRGYADSISMLTVLVAEMVTVHRLYEERSVGMRLVDPSRRLFDRLTELIPKLEGRLRVFTCDPGRIVGDIDLDRNGSESSEE